MPKMNTTKKGECDNKNQKKNEIMGTKNK